MTSSAVYQFAGRAIGRFTPSLYHQAVAHLAADHVANAPTLVRVDGEVMPFVRPEPERLTERVFMRRIGYAALVLVAVLDVLLTLWS